MKEILEIYKSDLRAIFKSATSIIMIIALIIVPCLYAWVNIDAAWDPYSNTGGIKVAVANNDAGGVFDVTDTQYNAGDMLIEQLEENDSLDWCFVNEKDARDGVDAGDYYAALIIPENFTEDLLSISTDDIVQPEIKYLVNEKVNPITPIITKKGTETIKYEIRSKFVELVNGMIFKIANVAGNTAEKSEDKIDDAIDTIHRLNDLTPTIDELLKKVDNGEISIKEFSEKSKELFSKAGNTNQNINNNFKELISYFNAIKMSLNQTSPLINEALKSGTAMAQSYKSLINSININDSSDNIRKSLVTVRDSLNEFDAKLIKIINLVNGMNGNSNTIESLKQVEQSVVYIVAILDGTVNKIDNGETLSADRLESIKSAVNNTCNLIIGLNSDGSYVLSQVNKTINDTINACTEVTNLLSEFSSVLNDMYNAENMLELNNLDTVSFTEIKEKFPEIKQKLNNFVKDFDELNYEDKKQKLTDLLQIDWNEESTFLSSPIDIDKEIMYSVDNYGSEITPFYTSLGLWIGALLLVVFITYRARNYTKNDNVTPLKEFLGKYLFFITIGVIQGIVAALGDLLVLGVDNKNPFLFIIFSIFISMVFQTIVYVLTSIFGLFGKGVSLVILVIQVAAAGGIYPVQVTVTAFEWLHPFLPFTYSIGLFREAIGGITTELLWKNILMLLLFMAIFLLAGIRLRKTLGEPNDPINKSFKESGLE